MAFCLVEIRGLAARDTERYAWWSLLDRLACVVKLKTKKKPEPSLLRLEQWAQDAWPRAIALFRERKGETAFRAFLGELLQIGKTKLSERDLALIRIAKSR